MTCHEVAELLGISPTTAKIWASKRKFSVVKVGRLIRIAPEALDEWIRENTVKSPPKGQKPRFRAQKRANSGRFDDVLDELRSEGPGRGRK